MAEDKAVAPAHPVTPDAMTQLTAILDRLTQQPTGISAETIEAIATASAHSAAKVGAESLRSVLHPQNASHPGKSVFSHPEGDVAHPKATLRPRADGTAGDCFFCYARQESEQLTPQQVDLFNRFTRSTTARNGRWRADIAHNGVDLLVVVPCSTVDERMELPSLDLILLELLDGQASVDAVSLAGRVAQLEAQLAARA